LTRGKYRCTYSSSLGGRLLLGLRLAVRIGVGVRRVGALSLSSGLGGSLSTVGLSSGLLLLALGVGAVRVGRLSLGGLSGRRVGDLRVRVGGVGVGLALSLGLAAGGLGSGLLLGLLGGLLHFLLNGLASRLGNSLALDLGGLGGLGDTAGLDALRLLLLLVGNLGLSHFGGGELDLQCISMMKQAMM
jgi:hypothetical protein